MLFKAHSQFPGVSFLSQMLIYLDFVWFNELCIGVDIVDILVSQRHPVSPVQWADVVVNRRLHRLPVVFHWGHVKHPQQELVEWKQHRKSVMSTPSVSSPDSSNSQPNLRASCMAVLSMAVWCISFLGMQPTFTQVPPRPDQARRAHRQHGATISDQRNNI